MSFEPVAIVGRGCVLPGALSPADLWDLVSQGRDVLGEPPGGYWGLRPEDVETTPDEAARDHTWSSRGGYVRGFGDVFDPSGFGLPEDELLALDPLFTWTLHAAREALREAGHDPSLAPTTRGGVILGNLSYPTRGLAEFAEQVWRARSADRPDWLPLRARQRFTSGLPAQLVARATGLVGESFSLDAACASSLYAMKLACDRLHDGRADVMLAGGINHADDLFLHIGFCALNAMSKTGQSRPFHRGADGLVPAEGAGFVVLKRLADARAAGDHVYGVIRGVGLSNDGRGRGMLTPSEEGQERAMRAAYAVSGLTPDDVSLIECHATGTPLGDATELRSMARVFEGRRDVPLGSIKSNMGHPITASGVAGLLKITEAMAHGQRPPTLHARESLDVLDGSPFRLLHEVEPWEVDGIRRAGINNFGFGGNNAHLLVEEHDPSLPARALQAPGAELAQPAEPIAIVAVGAILGDRDELAGLVDAALGGASLLDEDGRARADQIELPITSLKFPPNDLGVALPQQLITLQTSLQLEQVISGLDRARTGVLMGMQCDAEIARYGARWRLGEWARRGAIAPPAGEGDDGWIDRARDGIIDGLVSAGVLGTMPNIVANRLNSQYDVRGPSYTVSAEQASGTVSLDLATHALRHGEVDAAVVGAVDMSCEPVQEWAASQLLPSSKHQPGDAAVLLVLKRLADAREAGDDVWAILDDVTDDLVTQRVGDLGNDLTDRVGHAHAASGLVHVAAAAIACRERAQLATYDRAAQPWLPRHGQRCVEVTTHALSGQTFCARLRADTASTPAGLALGSSLDAPHLELYAADDFSALAAAVAAGEHGSHWGSFRLSIFAKNADELSSRRASAASLLSRSQPAAGQLEPGVHYGEGTAAGEVAFVFTGPAGAYPQMGRSLLLAAPALVDDVARRFDQLDDACGWLYDADADTDRPPVDKLWGSSFLCQTHAAFTRDLLGVRADAAIGFCSGETNALFAMGAWEDLGSIHSEIERRGVFTRALGGEMTAVRERWGLADGEPVDWVTWRLRADADDVRAALAEEDRAHLTIINAPGDVVIAGNRAACQRGVDRLGVKPRDLGYNIAMHCPEAAQWSEPWRDLHHRPTSEVDGVRFYTNAGLTSYAADADAAADALTGQAMSTVDFPALVERAWDDGVRIFIEHGPHDGCSQWISKTLGDREHLAIGLDRFGIDSLRRANEVVATIWAAGVPLDARRWLDTITPAPSDEVTPRPRALTFPAHLPEVRFPEPYEEVTPEVTPAPVPEEHAPMSHDDHPQGAQRMNPAPTLPSVHSEGLDLGVAFAPAPTPAAPLPASAPAAPAAPAAPRLPAARPPAPGPEAGPVADIASRWASYHSGLVDMHENFLRQQSAVHKRFLEVQHAAMNELAAFATGTQAPASAPAPRALLAAPAPAAPAPVASAPRPAPRPASKPVPKPAPRPAPKPAAAKPTPPAAKPAPAPAPQPAAKKVPGAQFVTNHDGTTRSANIKPTLKREPVGPSFDRAQLAIHADGKISEIFGPEFEQQDDHAIQVRMPHGKLLLADRVLGIDAPKGVVGTGTLWTETDVREDHWFLHEGRMPVGIMIETGQADLMLISWMGADFANNGDRAYRLLGCELTFHSGGLPQPGDTLRYDIHIDGHANQGPIRLFFFHYDCSVNGTPRLSVRGGQAGFFTYEELAASKGILWKPSDVELDPDARVDPPRAITSKTRWEREDLEAFGAGDIHAAFGPEFFIGDTHTRPPRIQYNEMLFVDVITDFDPTGGPYDRGYLRATKEVTPDWWVFDGHFKNDPCMPGTMMFEGCVQTMAFYLTAMGYTLNNDGWVFEPVPEVSYKLRCRGQVRPEAKEVIYEVFVREVHEGPYPTLYADLLCTVDGLGAFLCENMGLQLAPGWPMDRAQTEEIIDMPGEPIASHGDFEFDHKSLLSCALGRPSEAFGPLYEVFDTHRRVARLPGPPYHFMTRVRSVSQPMNSMKAGVEVEVDYVVPSDAWYFDDNAARVMPLAVLMEVGLQPCGWLASYAGCALSKDTDLFFRNLDGTGTQFIDVTPETGRLRSHVNLKTVARAGGNIIVAFDVRMTAPDQGDALVYEMDTVFGFFPPSSLAAQAGLGAEDSLSSWALGSDLGALDAPIDLSTGEGSLFGPGASLASGKLLMLDRVTGWWPDAGEAGLGRVRANKDVVPSEWFFKAHFYQDPVQPGSLGIEALLQVLQSAMLLGGLDEGLSETRFEPISLGDALTWRYRGQVLPHNELITASAEITEVRREDGAVVAVADASLWVDGMRIYHAPNMAMRLVGTPSDEPSDAPDDGDDAEGEDYVLELIDTSEVDVADTNARFPSSSLEATSVQLDATSAEPLIPTPPTRRFTPSDLDYLDSDVSSASEVFEDLLGGSTPAGSAPNDDLRELSDSTPSLEVASGTGLEDRSSSGESAADPSLGQLISDSVVDDTPRADNLDSGEFAVRTPSRSSTPIAGLDALPSEPGLDESSAELEELGTSSPQGSDASDGSSISESSISESSSGEDDLGAGLSSESSEDLTPDADDAHSDSAKPARRLHPLTPRTRPSTSTPIFGIDSIEPDPDPHATPLSGLDALQSEPSDPLSLDELSNEVGFTMLESSVVDEDDLFDFTAGEDRANRDRTVIDLSPLGSPEPSEAPAEVEPSEVPVEVAPHTPAGAVSSDAEEVLDPSVETWLWDHCPTYTAPALPMMSIMDRLAQAALRVRPDLHVVRIEDVALRKWVIASDLQIIKSETAADPDDPDSIDVILSTWWEAPNPNMSRFDEVARARVVLAPEWSAHSGERIAHDDLAPIPDPYDDGSLFHGPAFQVLTSVERGARGARGQIDLARASVPVGALNPVLLDGALQIIPHDSLELWWDGHPGDSIAYPRAVESFTVHGPTPSLGVWTAEVEFVEARDAHTPVFDVHISQGGMIWATMRLVEVLFPKGPLGRADGRVRRAFLRDRVPTPGLSLATRAADGSTSLSTPELRASDWFKGTIAAVYDGVGLDPTSLTRAVAIKDHVALDSATHPAWVLPPEGDGSGDASSRALPMWRHPIEVAREDDRTVVRDAGAPGLDLAGLDLFWREELEVGEGWLGGDIYSGLIERYVDRVFVEDPAGFERLRGQSAIFLGNHETQIESVLVTAIASYLIDGVVVTMANAKHERGWVGDLVRLMFSYPGAQDPKNIVYFEQSDPASMIDLVAGFKRDIAERGASVMVHAPGTRAVQAGQPVERLSSLFVDMALELGLPIVPVAFDGGLPSTPLAQGKLEFPVDQGSQSYSFGAPIWPDELGALEYARRRQFVMDRINRLLPDAATAAPHPTRPEWAQEIAAWDQQTGAGEIGSTLFHVLAGLENPGRDALELLRAAESWSFAAGDDPHSIWLARAARLLFGPDGPEIGS